MSSPDARPTPYATDERTIVFADVCGSAALFDRHGNERALQVVGRAVEVLTEATVRHGGEVVKTIGDEVMATFALAASAVEAAGAMHRAVTADPLLGEHAVEVKVGLHAGEVILENDDVFGDAVNVAARMVGLAKPGQILTTSATVERLPRPLGETTRRLGHTRVRGKSDQIELCEVVWQEDREALTTIGLLPWTAEPARDQRLVLEQDGSEVTVEATGAPFQLGRGPQCDLVVQGRGASRHHATITFNRGHFVLTDRSTNGTTLQLGGEEVFLHRDQTVLLRSGRIRLGRAPSSDAAEWIRFRCE